MINIKIFTRVNILFSTFLTTFIIPTLTIAQEYQIPVMTFKKDAEGFFVNQTDLDYVDYMWNSFVALNWPAKQGVRGQPDTSKKQPAVQSPVVWQTYAQPQEALLPPSYWGQYPQWNDLPRLPVGMTDKALAKLCGGYDRLSGIALHAINQPSESARQGPVAPLQDQFGRYVRYQVTLNKTFFEYLRVNKYYNADIQSKAVEISQKAQFKLASHEPEGAFKALPFDNADEVGMLETKAAWRILDPEHDNPERYYTQPAVVLSPDKKSCFRGTAALVALHIHRNTKFGHVASTFEQIDNVRILDPNKFSNIKPSFNPGMGNTIQTNTWPPYGNRGFDGNLPPLITNKDTLPDIWNRQPVNISRASEIPLWLQIINKTYQKKYQYTPLNYYQMINVQHASPKCRRKPTGNWANPVQWSPETCPTPNIQRLINSALESYTQLTDPYTNLAKNYSCRSCHSNARPCGILQENKNLFTWRNEFQVMSFILGKAVFPGTLKTVDEYACNIPQTIPPDVSGGMTAVHSTN